MPAASWSGAPTTRVWPSIASEYPKESADEVSCAASRWCRLQAPVADHWVGTDASGRDGLARNIHGSLSSQLVAVGSIVLCTLFGVILGALAAYFGGLLDRATLVLIETMTAFPTFFLILAVQGLLGASGLLQLVVIIGATRWTDVARVTRADM